MTGRIAINSLDDFSALKGKALPPSPWRDVDQAMIDRFADATGDRFWIHVDAEKAATGPFGATVMHGFHSLSLIPKMFNEIFDFTPVFGLNYGLDRVRFTSPVRVGTRIRLSLVVAEVRDVDNGIDLVLDCIVEIEGEAKPACVARFIMRFHRSQ